MVWFLVTRLSLNIAELVHAYMMFEACVAPAGGRKGTRPGLLGINYVRRLFFGCCSLAIKVGHDVRAARTFVAACKSAWKLVKPFIQMRRKSARYSYKAIPKFSK